MQPAQALANNQSPEFTCALIHYIIFHYKASQSDVDLHFPKFTRASFRLNTHPQPCLYAY